MSLLVFERCQSTYKEFHEIIFFHLIDSQQSIPHKYNKEPQNILFHELVLKCWSSIQLIKVQPIFLNINFNK